MVTDKGEDMSCNVILVATDGTDRARVAVGQAIALAKATGATLHAVHVVHPVLAVGFSDTHAGQIEIDQARDDVARVRDAIAGQARAEGISVEVHNPGNDDAASGIIDTAESVEADIVVVGNKGMTGLKRFVLSSVPNKVAHNCPRNVMIVNTESA